MIEETQKQLGDAMKALDKEVKDSIATLWIEVSELAATMKVIMMAIGKTPIVSDALKCKGKEKVLEPRLNAKEKNAQKIKKCVDNMK